MSLGRNAITVTVASITGQLLQFSALPLISRYAAPQAFGTFGLFAGFCALFAVFAGLRYDNAIIVASSDRQARSVASLMTVLGAAVSVLGFFGGLLTARIGGWFDASSALLLSAAGFLYIVANTVVRTTTNWLVRGGFFGWVGLQQFIAIVSTVLLQLGLLILSVDAVVALACGFAGGQVTAALLGCSGPGRRVFVAASFRPAAILGTARYFSAFPRYMLLYGLSTQLRDRAVQVIVGAAGGPDSLGKFVMTQRLVGTPQGFLHAGIGPALMKFARGRERSEVAATAVNMMEIAWLVLAPGWIFAAFNAEFIFSHFFGPKWAGVELVFKLLTAPYLLLCCTAFIDRLFEFYGNQRTALRIDLTYSTLLLSTMIALAFLGSAMPVIVAFTLVFALYEIVWTWRTFVVNDLPRAPLARAMGRVLLVAALLLAGNALLVLILESFWIRAFGAAIVTGAIYLVYWRRFRAGQMLASMLRGQ